MIQVTELIYLVAEEIDGSRGYEEIAGRVGERYGKEVSADNVKTLVEENLAATGLLAGREQEAAAKPDQLLALKFKFTLVPEKLVNFIAALLRPLFWPPIIFVVVGALVALDVWYFGIHGIAQSIRDVIYQPLVVLMIYGLLIVSVMWHELGHAAACRYGGARPGRIGFGLYVVWPTFFTDVSDALKLAKGGRVRTDLGGLYFNMLFSLAVGGVYFLTGFEPLLVLIVMQHMIMLYNLVPFLRLDGYHTISDITGIPDLFGRIKPALKGMVPWKDTPDEVTELKRWARTVVTVWVILVIPVLLYLFGMMILSLPRVVATGWDSVLLQWDKLQSALDEDALAKAAVAGLQAALIVLPATGMFVSLSHVGKRIVTGFVDMTSERPILRTSLGFVGVAAIATAVYVLIPNGEYRPIQEGEDWTVADSFAAMSEVESGRPSLPEARQEELGGAPGLHETGQSFESSYRRTEAEDPAAPAQDPAVPAGDDDADETSEEEEPSEDEAEAPAPTPTEEEPESEETPTSETEEEEPTPTPSSS